METLLIDLLPYLFSLAITLGLAVITFRRRSVLGARSFLTLILVEVLETVGFILELAAPTLNGKMFWDNYQWFTTLLLGVAMLSFSLEYIGKSKPVVRRWIGLLVIVSLSLATMISVDLFPGLGIISPRLIAAEPFSIYKYEFGPLTYLSFIYSYIMTLAGFYILGREALRKKDIFRLQTFIILIGLFIPMLGTILVLMGVELLPNRDILPLTFPVGNILIVFGLFRYRIFDIVPIARTAVMNYIADPVVVLDNRDIILDTNPAFVKMLKLPKRKLVKKPIQHFLPSLQPLDKVVQHQAVQDEIVLPIGEEKRFLDTSSRPFNNRLGDYGGRLLILHDITEHKQLEEKERLRGENLEKIIQKRSAELVKVNKKLQEKVAKQSRLEKELQRETINLEAIFESSPVAMLVLDETTNIIMANRAAIILSGGTQSEVLQHRPGNALRCVHSHDDPSGCGYSKACSICSARNGIESLLASGGSLQGTVLPLVLIRNGEPQNVWLEMGAEKMLINGRRHLCVAMNDVTERKKSEEEIQVLSRFPNENPNPVMRISFQGEIEFANAAAGTILKIWEKKVGQVLPMPLRKVVLNTLQNKQNEDIELACGEKTFLVTLAPIVEEKYINLYGRDITERKQAEDALKYSQNLLAETEKIGNIGGWEFNIDTQEQKWTEGVYRIHEVDPAFEPMVSEGINFYTPEYRPVIERAVQRAIDHGEPFDVELEINTAKGNLRSVNAIGIPDLTHRKVTGFFQDITERKQAEGRLALNSQRTQVLLQLNQMREEDLKEIMNFALEEAVRLTRSTIGYLAFLNEDESVLTMHSWSKTAMAECAINEKPIVYPVNTTGLWGEAVRQRGPVITNDYAAVNPLKKGIPQGHVSVKRHMNIPVFMGSRIVLVAGVGNKTEEYDHDDVEQLTLLMEGMWQLIERKQAEEKLQIREERYRSLVETQNSLIARSDLNGNLTFINDVYCEVFGKTKEELLGHIYLSNILSEDIKITENAHNGLSKPPHRYQIETRHHTPKGIRWLRWEGSVVRNNNGEIVEFQGVGDDITERKQAEEKIHNLNAELEQRVIQRTAQLKSANEELKAFSYSVSHDLRAPLRGIDGWSLALMEDYGGQLDGKAKSYLERVRAEAQHMGQLIDDLLQLSRLNSVELSQELLDLSAIAGKIAAQMQAAQPDRKVKVVTQPGLKAKGDARLLEIAFTNLLDNAFKFTGKTPQANIQFGQTLMDGQPAFFVRDNGAGFDMAFAGKLFGAFQRMHSASDFPGSGIGLSIVQRIIHRHGGRIWAEAEKDKGATFYFTLKEIS